MAILVAGTLKIGAATDIYTRVYIIRLSYHFSMHLDVNR